jgi:hypothetical protein
MHKKDQGNQSHVDWLEKLFDGPWRGRPELDLRRFWKGSDILLVTRFMKSRRSTGQAYI